MVNVLFFLSSAAVAATASASVSMEVEASMVRGYFYGILVAGAVPFACRCKKIFKVFSTRILFVFLFIILLVTTNQNTSCYILLLLSLSRLYFACCLPFFFLSDELEDDNVILPSSNSISGPPKLSWSSSVLLDTLTVNEKLPFLPGSYVHGTIA